MNDKDYNLLMCTCFNYLIDIFGVEKTCVLIYGLNKKRGLKI